MLLIGCGVKFDIISIYPTGLINFMKYLYTQLLLSVNSQHKLQIQERNK